VINQVGLEITLEKLRAPKGVRSSKTWIL